MSADFMSRLALKVERFFPVQPGERFEAFVARARALADEKVSAGRLRAHLGKRAMIASAIHEVSREIETEAQARKTAWVAAARLGFQPGRRQPCAVCGRFRDIAEAHHVVPLAAQFDRGFQAPDHEHVWLCPNHHAAIHVMIASDDPARLGSKAAGVIADLSEAELRAILDLISRSGRGA